MTTHYTPVFIDTKTSVLDVEGYVPKEAILDTRATKVMLSKNIAAAMAIHAVSLAKGTQFVTASGAVEVPLGVTYSTVEFYLGRGTPHALSVHLHVTVVDTTAYDVLLGTEFMAAVRAHTTVTLRCSPTDGTGSMGNYASIRCQHLAILHRLSSSRTRASAAF